MDMSIQCTLLIYSVVKCDVIQWSIKSLSDTTPAIKPLFSSSGIVPGISELNERFCASSSVT